MTGEGLAQTSLKPETSGAAGTYVLRWPDLVTITIDRVDDDSHHVVSGEITIRTLLPTDRGLIHQARLNLTSTTSRVSLVRHLKERVPEMVDLWSQIIEYATVWVLQQHRQGEPMERLWHVQPPEGITYRFRPLLLEGQVNLLFGAGGIGKSFLSQWIAYCVDSAHNYPDEGWDVEPGTVLYLDYERDKNLHRRRFDAIRAGVLQVGVEDHIQYRRCYRPLVDEITDLRRMCYEAKVDLLIVDSAGGAAGGEAESNEMAIKSIMALRSLGITCLIIAHEPKNAENKTPFGASYWTNLPSSVWRVRADLEPGSNEVTLGLYHHKVNDGRLLKPFGYKLSFVNDEQDKLQSVRFDHASIMDSSVLAESVSTVERAAELLKHHGPMSNKALAEELNVKPDSLRAKLNQGKWKHRFGKDGMDNWHLVDTIH